MSTCLWMIEYVANSRSTIFPSADYDEELMAVQIACGAFSKASVTTSCRVRVTSQLEKLCDRYCSRDNSEN